MAKTEYGLQMYSVRDITGTDLKGSLQKVAEMGYKYIEFTGFFGNTADDVKSWLDEFHLTCSGSYTSPSQLTDDTIDETIAYLKTIGCSSVITASPDWPTEEVMDQNIELINTAQKKLAENGIVLSYHNHSHELVPTAYGKIIEDEIIRRTSVDLHVDTFWIFNAGLDPVAYCDNLKDRIHGIHLKDGIPTAPENRVIDHVHDNVIGMSLGSGQAPVLAVRQWALDNNVLMVVESEGLQPTGPEEVKRCIDYLRSIE